jgi:hypothetical protein
MHKKMLQMARKSKAQNRGVPGRNNRLLNCEQPFSSKADNLAVQDGVLYLHAKLKTGAEVSKAAEAACHS